MKKKERKKVLALIGARSGSTSLKNKNILNLSGKPLMSWIINTAKKVNLIDRIVVSTDSKKYQRIAMNYGAESPFLRPKSISGKLSNEIEYVKHAIKFLKQKEKYTPDIIVRLLATSPFQKYSDIQKAIKIYLNNKCDSVVIISKAKQHPMKALKIIGKGNNKSLVGYFDNKGESASGMPRQIFSKAYFRSNVIIFNPKLLNKNTMTGKKVKYLIVKSDKNIDIDDKIDFEFAKFLAKK
tara:strand:- start:9817 stop:10533 length:717 start_codon:yes stop_codon:yes gene_type:complete